ncbi:response regulator receiver domain [Marinomonas primoryensis]|uniref:Response regulator receiver domain n=1 Tax=Marinomonas primoryensis TaxID=178399 RepID=A0ABV0KXI4_9GAMM
MTDIAAETYQDLIKEAFIAPIRTVTIIDDEYPTLQELLQQSDSKKLVKSNNISRLMKISEMCHKTHNWSLDVFDGQSPRIGEDNDIPDHLNHSDLLILDYHLDGEPPTDDGARSRKIIKKLDLNNHFNIILVHTKGVEENIEDVYEEILFDLNPVKKPDFLEVSEDSKDKIEAWLDENDDGSEYSWLSEDTNYSKTKTLELLECSNYKLFFAMRNPQHLFYPHHNEISSLSGLMDVEQNDLIKWRLLEICKNQKITFTDESRSDLSWDWNDSGVNYIATGKVFISVIRKVSEDPETELFDALCNSLNQFNASPMHLLMAKIRHEIDDRGFEQAQKIISNRPAQAGWLFSLLSQPNESFAHDKAIDLHWEQLGRASKASLRKFSQRMSEALAKQDSAKNIVKDFFRECIGNADESCSHLNAFTCSMPVVSRHLNTGTVFCFDKEYWVCLTPACDLVPGQKAQWSERIGDHSLAFKAVKLHEVSFSLANSKALTNEYIYLNLEDSTSIKVFAFLESPNANPVWDTFFANNQGRLFDSNKIGLACVREIEESLQLISPEAEVVAELRYEYALNLLQRLGANQTRVGLDFIQKDKLWQ